MQDYTKELSEKFIDMVENTFGRKFPINVETQTHDDVLQDDEEWER